MILIGDAETRMRELASESVQTCVTSPPYWDLRDYGCDGQIGREGTLQEYVQRLVATFREVRRVLRKDGTLWLNLGDAYAGNSGGGMGKNSQFAARKRGMTKRPSARRGAKPKDLLGLPWLLAFALRADGWWLRSEIIWRKPNALPETAADRPAREHETVFLLSKARRYFYDRDAVRTPLAAKTMTTHGTRRAHRTADDRVAAAGWAARAPERRPALDADGNVAGAALRSVWTIATVPLREAHDAAFPPALAERCIRLGSRGGDVVLDPFAGAGTTWLAASRLGRAFVGVEINERYAALATERVRRDAPLLMTKRSA